MAKEIDTSLTIRIFTDKGECLISASSSIGKTTNPAKFNWNPTPEQLIIISRLVTHQDEFGLYAPLDMLVSFDQVLDLGRAMYQAVFTPPIERLFGGIVVKGGTGKGTRIRLVIEPVELARLPWEFMYDGEGFVVLRSDSPLVRGFISTPTSRPTAIRGKLKILYAWANPDDQLPLELEKTAATIRAGLAENRQIQFDLLTHATHEKLEKALDQDYHIVCLACHGSEDHIYLEQEQGGHEEVSVAGFIRMLEGKNDTRLVFLDACELGVIPSGKAYSFAQNLASMAKIPVVLAMQFEVGDEAANRLTSRYFQSLAAFRPVDAALSEARKTIFDDHKIISDVFAPVLYLQSANSNLFPKPVNWRRIALALVLMAFLLLGLAFGVFTFFQAQAKQSESRQLAAQVSNQLTPGGGGDILEAAHLSVQSYTTAQTRDAEKALFAVAAEPFPVAVFQGSAVDISTDGVSALVVNKDQHTLLSWDIPHNRQLWAITEQNRQFSSPKISPDGKTGVFISSPVDNLIAADMVTIDISTGQEKTRFSNITPSSVAFNRTGNILLASWAVSSGMSQVWDLRSNEMVMRTDFTSANDGLISPDGTKMIMGTAVLSANKPLEIRSIPDGAILAKLKDYTGTVNSAAFSPNGKQVITSGNDGKLRIWDSATGQQLSLFDAPDAITAAFFDSSENLIFALAKQSVTVWEASSHGKLHEFPHYAESLSANAIDHQGQRIITTGADNEAHVTTIIRSAQSTFLHGHAVTGLAARFTSDGKYAITDGSNGTARLWRLTGLQELSRWQKLDRAVGAITTMSGQVNVLATRSNTAWIVDNTTGKDQLVLTGHNSDITAAAFSSDGSRLVTGSQNGALILWDTAAGKSLHSWQATAGITSIVFSQDGKQFATGTQGGTIQVWQIGQNQPTAALPQPSPIVLCRFNPEGSKLVTLDEDGLVRVWNPQNGQRLAQFADESGATRDVGFQDKAIIMVSARSDGTVMIWDAESGKSLAALRGHTQGVYLAMISPDGSRIATISADETFRLWDTRRGNQLIALPASDANIQILMFNPGGSLIATGHLDGNIRLWDPATGQLVSTLQCGTDISSIHFTKDGKRLIAECGRDPSVITWSTDPGELVRLIGEALSNLVTVTR